MYVCHDGRAKVPHFFFRLLTPTTYPPTMKKSTVVAAFASSLIDIATGFVGNTGAKAFYRHSSGLDALTDPSAQLTTVKDVWGIEPNLMDFPGAAFALGGSGGADSPPILELPNFLSVEECAQIKKWAVTAIDSGADECDDYLNFRVNQEVREDGSSQEGKALIDECDVNSSSLSASSCGGFRVRLDKQVVDDMIKERILDLLGFGEGERDFVYEEGLWVRPSPRTVCIRDQTVVFYNVGDGVPPHVDGKDATLLVYLSDGKY